MNHFLVSLISLLIISSSLQFSPDESLLAEDMEMVSLHQELSKKTLNEITNRCRTSTLMKKCNESKLAEYTSILNELTSYFARYNSSPNNRISMSAKYMLISTLVKRSFHDLGFVGFYSVETSPNGTDRLEIAPYASNITAIPVIEKGKGACGESWEKGETLIVGDVTQHANYIACDDVTMSEIVVPHYDAKREKILAVFDIDADVKHYFEDTDQICLEVLLDLLNHI